MLNIMACPQTRLPRASNVFFILIRKVERSTVAGFPRACVPTLE